MLLFVRRISDWWNRDRLSAELDEELRIHQGMLERDARVDGLDPIEGRSHAMRRLGNATTIKERTRAIWNLTWLDELLLDIRFAGRVLRRRRMFGTTAVVTLAIAIAANTLIFTVVDGTLLRRLPYVRPEELVALFHYDARGRAIDKATGAEVTAWQSRTNLFAGVAFSWDAQYTLASATHSVPVRAFQFSGNLFDLLGQHAALGRTLIDADGLAGSDHVAVLSDRLWRGHFGAAPDIVGRAIRLDDSPYRVVGVMPPTFDHPEAGVDLWTPLVMPAGLVRDTSLHAFNVIARLHPGVTIDAARRFGPASMSIESIRDVYLGVARPVIWLLEGAVLLLLLITAANLANLVLAHATTTRREVALRRALGASFFRLLRHFVAQALVISVAACSVGVGIAVLMAGLVPTYLGQLFGAMPAQLAHGISPAALVVAVAIALLTTILFGGLMMVSARGRPGAGLASDARAGSVRPRDARFRTALIGAQIAISLVLLASSLLLIRSFLNIEHRSLGFSTMNRLTLLVRPRPDETAGSRTALYVRTVLANIRALPGVRAAGATSALPLTGVDARRRLHLRGSGDSAGMTVNYRVVSPEYFATMHVPLISGRVFTAADRAGGIDVALVNETLARARWHGRSPIGEQVTIAGGPTPMSAQVVGVIGDVRHNGLATNPEPEIYRPLDQAYWPFFGIVVETAANPALLTKSVEDAIWAVDRTVPIDRVQTLDSVAADTLALRRISMVILTAFAFVATLLAAVGIYGVASYVVSLRAREIGIRVALGATPATVMRRVLGLGVRVAVVGSVVGVIATEALTRYLASLLFGVSPTDTASLAVAGALTTAIAILATYAPARRAARIDPAIALRGE